MDGLNLKCEQLKQMIVNCINTSGVPISSAYYIMQLLTSDLEKTYYNQLKVEQEEQQKSEQEQSEEAETE
jgi:hypothetical protein